MFLHLLAEVLQGDYPVRRLILQEKVFVAFVLWEDERPLQHVVILDRSGSTLPAITGILC